MSKQEKKDQTQQLIKETTKNLFFVKGKFDATTQEIADEAGVNRTLINYYFRSRDNLVQIVFYNCFWQRSREIPDRIADTVIIDTVIGVV